MAPSDQELVKQLCRHNAAAFELLSARYRDMIYRHIHLTLHDNDATEDVVQEVFLRLWTRAEQWNGRGTFKAWLFRIATNLALNYLRTVRRRRQQPLELPSDQFDDDEEQSIPHWMIDLSLPGPDQLLERSERHTWLQHLIDGLPTEKREVFRLVHDAEMETGQVAATLGIPEGTVKSRLHYATKRLAREWKDKAKEWEDT